MDSIQSEKLVLLGEPHVGKTSIARRLSPHNFFTSSYVATMGLEMFTFNHGNIPVQVWEAGGEELMYNKSTCKAAMNGATCVVLVYDTTDRTSLTNCDRWFELLKQIPGIPVMLVANKTDMVASKQVIPEEGIHKARAHGAMHGLCSIKHSRDEIVGLVTKLLNSVLEKRRNAPPKTFTPSSNRYNREDFSAKMRFEDRNQELDDRKRYQDLRDAKYGTSKPQQGKPPLIPLGGAAASRSVAGDDASSVHGIAPILGSRIPGGLSSPLEPTAQTSATPKPPPRPEDIRNAIYAHENASKKYEPAPRFYGTERQGLPANSPHSYKQHQQPSNPSHYNPSTVSGFGDTTPPMETQYQTQPQPQQQIQQPQSQSQQYTQFARSPSGKNLHAMPGSNTGVNGGQQSYMFQQNNGTQQLDQSSSAAAPSVAPSYMYQQPNPPAQQNQMLAGKVAGSQARVSTNAGNVTVDHTLAYPGHQQQNGQLVSNYYANTAAAQAAAKRSGSANVPAQRLDSSTGMIPGQQQFGTQSQQLQAQHQQAQQNQLGRGITLQRVPNMGFRASQSPARLLPTPAYGTQAQQQQQQQQQAQIRPAAPMYGVQQGNFNFYGGLR